MTTNIIQELYNRGLIEKLTDENNLLKIVQEKKINVYCGFDPTADSLHIGHLIPLLCLKHFYLNNHIPIILIGGATALVGDPSFKKKDAEFLKNEVVFDWTQKIEKQIKNFILCKNNLTSLKIVNNYSWLKDLTILNFLRKFGIYCSINKLLNKESIKIRLKKKDHLSFMTFSYSFLQGYDYCFLNKKHNVILQIGGSDQWGNITLGIDLVSRVNKKSVYGLTTPLMVRSNGSKLGKSDKYKSVIWLDKNKTSVYDFYQFWINSPDKDVFKFLKMFTFLKISDICKLKKKFIHKQIKPFVIQKILAQEITRIVHGEKQLDLVQKATEILFHKDIMNISEKNFILLSISGMCKYKIFEKNIDLKSVLVGSGLSKSKKNANDMILCSAISVNNRNISVNYIFNDADKLYNKYTILKKGKKNFCLLIWINEY